MSIRHKNLGIHGSTKKCDGIGKASDAKVVQWLKTKKAKID